MDCAAEDITDSDMDIFTLTDISRLASYLAEEGVLGVSRSSLLSQLERIRSERESNDVPSVSDEAIVYSMRRTRKTSHPRTE